MKKVIREEFKFDGETYQPTGKAEMIEVTDYQGEKMVQNDSDRSHLIVVHKGKVIQVNTLLDMNDNLIAQNVKEIK